MSSIPVCEVLPIPSPLPQLLSPVPSFGEVQPLVKSLSVRPQDVPSVAKSLSLRSQASTGSLQLLAKQSSIYSMELEGDVSPGDKALEVTVLAPSSDSAVMEDAAVIVPINDEEGGCEDSEDQEKATADEAMDTDEAGPSKSNEVEPSDVPAGSSGTDAPNGAAPYMGPAPIEIIISFDTTGSMSYYLDEVKNKVQDIIQRLFMDIPNMKIGVMAHGDYCDESVFYLMQKVDFTNDVGSLCQFVKDVEGTGGGDFEECYEWVLSQVRKLDWTPGTQRSLIMIGDAIPHPTDYHLNKDKLDWKAEADALYNEQGVRIYAVQCQNEKGAAEFWKELAHRTRGHHLKLDQFNTIVDILMAICYREHSAEYFEVSS